MRIREQDFEDVQQRMDNLIVLYGEDKDKNVQDLFKIFGQFYLDFRNAYTEMKEKEDQERRKAEREAKKQDRRETVAY